MKLRLGILCFFVLCQIINAQEDPRCGIEGIQPDDWDRFLDLGQLKQTEEKTWTYNHVGDLSIISPTCNIQGFNPEVTDTELSFPFAKMDDKDLREIDGSIACVIKFKCPDNSELTLSVNLLRLDINEHEPQFSVSTLELLVPMPMLPRVDIFQFITDGNNLYVTDEDFKNDNIVFTISSDDFITDSKIETNQSSVQYIPTLTVKEPKIITNDLKLTLTATDTADVDGKVLTSTIEVTLKVDPDSSDVIATFSKSFYTFDYTIVPDGTDTITDVEIILNNAPGDVTPSLDILQENFNVAYDSTSQKISVALLKDLPDANLKTTPLILTLKADYGKNQDASVPLILNMPVTTSGPKFTKTYYTMAYNTEDKTITPVDGEVTTDNENAIVTISATDPHKGNFKLTQNPDEKTIWTIDADADLSEDDLKVPEVTIVLEAATSDSKEEIGKTAVVFQLAQKLELPEIAKPHYSAEYTINGEQHEVKLTDGPIIVKPVDAEVILNEDELSNFKLVPTENAGEYNLEINTNLNPEQLKQTDILIVVQATVNSVSASATIKIKLPNSEEIPQFTNPNYAANYDSEKDELIPKGDLITLSNPNADKTSVSITGGENKDLFEITQNAENAKQWIIKNKSKLTVTVSDIILTLGATLEDQTSYASYVISIEKTVEILPAFASAHYSASYSEKDQTVKLIDGPIQITNQKPADTTLTLIEDTENFSDHFELVKIDDQSYDVKLAKPLTPENLAGKSDFVLTIEAKLDTQSVHTALIIMLPGNDAPTFKSVYYSGHYEINDKNEATVTLDNPPITVDPPEAEVTFKEQEYKENFKLTKIDQDGNWEITASTPLGEEVLKKGVDIILTLEAKVNEEIEVGYATLIITLPGNDAPKFMSVYYSGHYEINDKNEATVTLDNAPITVDPPEAEVTFKEQEYKDNFKLTKMEQEGNWEITASTPLGEEILKIGGDLILTLEAKVNEVTEVGSATLIITLPANNAPKFKSVYYSGYYEINGDNVATVTLDNPPITVDPPEAVVTFKEPEYQENFKLTKSGENGNWELTALNTLDEEILKNGGDVILTLEATVNGITEVGNAPVIIALPSADGTVTPTFSSPYFTGDYDETINNIPIKNGPINVNPSDSTVEVIEEFKEYFEAKEDPEVAKSWIINIIKPLPDNLKDNGEVLVTLQATSKGIRGYSVLVVDIPTSKKGPSFSEIYYTADYTVVEEDGDLLEVTNGPIEVTGDIKEMVIEGYYAQYFGLQLETGKSSYVLFRMKDLDSDSLKNQDIVIVAKATNNEGISSHAPIVVNIIKHGVIADLPIFEKIHYEAAYSVNPDENAKDDVKVVDTITLIGTRKGEASVTVESDNEYNTFFKVENNKGTVTFSVLDNLSEPILKNTYIVVTIVASIKSIDGTSKTSIVIKLPSKDDPIDRSVKFDKESYIVPLTSGQNPDPLLTVHATSSKGDEITYSISSTTEGITINPTNGAITSSNVLKSGIHSMDVMATGGTTNEEDTDTVLVIVSVAETIDCPDGPRTAYTIKKIHIKEGRTYCKDGCSGGTEIMPLQLFNDENKVTWKVSKVVPTKFEAQFTLREDDTAVELKTVLSRDNDDLLRQNNQIVVTLEATKEPELKRALIKDTFAIAVKDATPEYLYLGDVENILNVLNVVVIIDDNNDFAPEFETTKKVLAYPKQELATQISPPYLTVLEASDGDAGTVPENIIYQSDHENVYVDSSTGQVYLSNEFTYEEFDFDVIAIDENGAGKRSNPLTITVKLLDEQNIFVLTTDNTKLSDIDAKLKALSAETGTTVNSLLVGVVPSITRSKKFNNLLMRYRRFNLPQTFERKLVRREIAAESATYTVQIIAYAISSDVPVTRDEFQQKLSDDTWSLSSWNKIPEGDSSEKKSDVGLIAGVSVLAVLLVITAAALIWMYIVKVRGMSTQNRLLGNLGDDVSIESSDKIFAKNPRLTTTSEKFSNDTMTRRPTGFIFRTDNKIDEDDTDNAVQPEIFERRKSVAFDDNVETLQIEGRDESDDKSEDNDDKNEDDSSVEKSRL